jgi:uncharacterized membrane protein YdjX (TVP38/TMEM64 family)
MLQKVTKSNLLNAMLLLRIVNKSLDAPVKGRTMPVSSCASAALTVAAVVFFASYSLCVTNFGLLFSYWLGWIPSWTGAYLAWSLTFFLCSLFKSRLLRART